MTSDTQRIERELSYLKGINAKTAAFISTTARKSSGLRVLPRRSAMGFTAINFLVTEMDQARACFCALDGHVDYIFIDIERKQDLTLIHEARRLITRSKVLTCKPNDATIESCDLLIRHHYADRLEHKSVLVVGSGNLSTKIALRLAERQAKVYLQSRNHQKTAQIAEALNLMLPKFSPPIQAIQEPQQHYTMIISFLSAERIIGPNYLPLLSTHSLVIDGGINNFTASFIQGALAKGVTCYRLDVRIAFLYHLLLLSNEAEAFFSQVMGRITVPDRGYDMVSGGIIGNRGDLIVDQVMTPTQVVGIADGFGGVKPSSAYTQDEKQRVARSLKALNAKQA
ncbi:hypothetical protein [Sporolactobacillus terrae]|uniref:Quinate/shikimate 5-dehydrogenase/glutamyl-tRNA reductase domain-containing protein n=1 Tax=Sporolactobacillus terrae TaxID=269673 RepID=A0A5K7X0B2_9BACL|nr:hypothetical protein [Sporolactobacillus terrae]QAA23817.1 hypothetical protein C0674_15150 [Sporolactobacillus terrae]UAK15851.1 hypothetical protein K7399_12675 [Sporolactobacillus terrae]BBO00356.1 hypothetical protein St703_30600 [Sporolactobacillus terrae]